MRPKMSDRTEFVQRGIVPCRECGKPHDAYRRPNSYEWGSWESREDGHPYRQMNAKEVVEYYESQRAHIGFRL